MSRFCFCNCPAGFSADPERHAPDCPGRSGAGKARTPVPATLTASQPVDSAVDFGIDGRSVRVSQEAYSIFLAREAAGREKIAALQQRLTAADERADKNAALAVGLAAEKRAIGERADVLEGLLRTSLLAMSRIYEAGRDFIVGTGSDCDSVELMMEYDPTAREIRAAIKPAEGGGDE